MGEKLVLIGVGSSLIAFLFDWIPDLSIMVIILGLVMMVCE